MDSPPELDAEGVRQQLEASRCQLAACREDLGEAYAMLAKAGLDWAKAQQVEVALQAQCSELSKAHEDARRECERMESAFQMALEECAGLRGQLDAVQQQRDRLHVRAEEADLRCARERREKEVLKQQLEDATSALAAEREALAEEQQRREGMEDAAVAVLNLALQAKQESEAEQQFRQSVEEAAVAAVAWVAREREGIQVERDRLAEERRELETAHGWREHSVRVKLHEAQVEVMERVQRVEALERAIRTKMEQRGLGQLWTEAEQEWMLLSVASLRDPLLCRQSSGVELGETVPPSSGRCWERDAAGPGAAGEVGHVAYDVQEDPGYLQEAFHGLDGPSRAGNVSDSPTWQRAVDVTQQPAAHEASNGAKASLQGAACRLSPGIFHPTSTPQEGVSWGVTRSFSVESGSDCGIPELEHTPPKISRRAWKGHPGLAAIADGCSSDTGGEMWASDPQDFDTSASDVSPRMPSNVWCEDEDACSGGASSMHCMHQLVGDMSEAPSETSESGNTLLSTDLSLREFFADASSCDDQSAVEDGTTWERSKPSAAKRGIPHTKSKEASQSVGRHTVVHLSFFKVSRWF